MPAHASRFACHFAALLGGGLVVVAAFAFRPEVTSWVCLGLGTGAVLAALFAFAAPDQGAAARTVELMLVVVGAWTILSCRVFAGPHALKWLCFANGVALFALGAAGLVAHEALLEQRLGRLEELERHRLTMTRPQAPSLLPDDGVAN